MTRTALVTGARHRIGAAIAAHLDGAGWRVYAHVREENDAVPDGCLKVSGDLARPDIGESLFAQLEGGCDLLVNNAAAFDHDDLGAPDAAMFERMMAINARAPYLLSSAFAKAGGAGDRSIVNILDNKLAAPNPDHVSYTLSKAALAGLTEVAARALAGQGIRVNAIAPALMLPSGDQDGEEFRRVHALNPLGRGVEPAQLLAALDALVDNPVLTGQTLWLDAGQRFMALPRDVAFLGEFS
ncbi:SDR family oxidoreductase [Sphingomicrobium astaxanthinifaciens]|uniref:SDR family oxidoreductase n=1 Tax=Sphingomicrobium astaxanthinifaciens TaxID=1227949 RepID=UPI001FCBFDF5|nr:SDR family oxidoreductase [Sphingomicrobium astaxanthinifaciens]MCJ7420564.1 SDR family oxidoreductase [Sphingomicrobium astaxanthinifaciens]